MGEFDVSWCLPNELGPGTVGVRLTESGQEIGFERVGWSNLLGLALMIGHSSWERVEVVDGREFLIIEHDEHVDRMMYEMINLLCALRCSHPMMLQLELALTEEQAVEMEEALGG